ncbi:MULTISPECIES: Hpt domain-containing protein [Oceanimonas]|uniref:Hpt domain-containing protein n=1 Tax=Oceanimonas smirnovii TaxID=264574 RepID=A0ABW7P2F2_9GAMM|nr:MULTISPECIES: Hpt domain-containing protein [Oceanimonas]MDV2858433.1 Hpt domain-containing protein [Oceanimonas sp. CAM02]
MADWQTLYPRLPLLDPARLEQLVKDLGQDALGRLLILFAEDGIQQGEALEQAFNEGNHEGMALWCHSLKSACGSYGALRCQFLAEKLEQACRQQQTDQVSLLMAAWQQALSDTLEAVQLHRESR